MFVERNKGAPLRVCRFLYVSLVAVATVSTPSVAENDLLPSVAVSHENLRVKLRRVAGSFREPTDFAGDGTGRYFVCQYDGKIHVLDEAAGSSTLYLDTRNGATLNDIDAGMTAIVFHPHFASPESPGFGKFYTIEPEHSFGGTPDFVPQFGNRDGDHSVVYEYTTDDIATPVFSGTKRQILRAEQPGPSHNVNDLAFDQAALLYIAVGDGLNDEIAAQNAQRVTNIYGKILRIDPLGVVGTLSANGAYSIPTTNPFVGEKDAREEIWAYGLRNPYRVNFDRPSGALYSGCVGQDNIEEINRIEAGGNYGWDLKEGSFVYRGMSATPTVDVNGELARDNNLIKPIFEYDHQDGATTIGGFVYRGAAIPELEGKYVWADFQGNRDGDPVPNRARLFYGNVETGGCFNFNIDLAGSSLPYRIFSIGEDSSGELYVLGNASMLKIEPPGGSVNPPVNPPVKPTEVPEPTARWTLDAADVVGTVVADTLGGLDGTIFGTSVTSVPGRFGEALGFSRSDDNYVDFGHVLDPETESFTVSLWFNADAVRGDPQFLLHKGNNDSAVPGWSIWIGEGNGRIHCRGNWCAESPGCTSRNTAGRFGQFIDDQGFLAGEWHHIAYVIDRENHVVRGFLDGSNAEWMPGGGGAQVDTLLPGATIAPETGLEGADPTLQMARRFTDGAPYGGMLDDVMVWKGTALTPRQVLALAEGMQPGVDPGPGPGPGPSSGSGQLTAYWSLDSADIVDGVVLDAVGAFDGTVVGTGVTNPRGFVGEALGFPDAATDFVDFGPVLDAGTESFTVSMWVNFDSLDLGFVFGKENIEGGEQSRAGWSIFVENGELLIVRAQQTDPLRGNDDIVEQRIDGQEGLVGQWNHITMVIDRDADAIRGYLNGSTDGWFNPRVAEGFIPGSRIESFEPLLMAKTNTNPGGAFGGLIDEVSIWRRALDSSEIQLLAEGLVRPTELSRDVPFRRGDADGDGELILTDGVFTLRFLFVGDTSPACRDAADSDDDGELTLNDAVFFFNFLFLGRHPPAAPFDNGCGQDPTEDELDCETYPEEHCL